MKFKLEDCFKKIDRAGRITIPKHIRYKGEISDDATLAFFTIEKDGRTYVAVSEATPEELASEGIVVVDQKYKDAVEVLQELGEDVPDAHMEKANADSVV